MFKDSFKYYKSRKDPPDLGTVIDFDLPAATVHPSVVRVARPPRLPDDHRDDDQQQHRRHRSDLRPPASWRVYELRDRPGLLFVRNPFTAGGQRYWMARSLRDYPRHPHAVNLRERSGHMSAAAVRDWWRTMNDAGSADGDRLRLRTAMRWATLGYHHNWDTKRYSERRRHRFPDDLAQLAGYVAAVLGVHGGGAYEAQAAIVNFYPQGTTLAGHTDHSERELEAPLFSFSFGQSAIFLVGGATVDERPSAVFLRSGDICVMSRQSRLSYHAVPRILHGAPAECWRVDAAATATAAAEADDRPIEPHAKRKKHDEADSGEAAAVAAAAGFDDGLDADLWRDVHTAAAWRPFGEYVAECRININVRQVLPSGVSVLPDDGEGDGDGEGEADVEGVSSGYPREDAP